MSTGHSRVVFGRPISRRHALALGGGVLATVAGGGVSVAALTRPSPVSPHGALVAATERARARTGRVVERQLTAAPARIDIGGRVVDTWAFNDSMPGPMIRATAGDELRIRLHNGLPDPTTVHWHGIALRNDMDGVPGVTMDAVAPGSVFDYRFVVPDPGTYWFHPHVGVQLDTGLSAALIIDDPNEPGGYDLEAVLILDDWTDGLGRTPAQVLASMSRDGMRNMTMSGMDMGAAGMTSPDKPLGEDTGDVVYPAHLINGRLPGAPTSIRARPGQRLRLRIINAASDTAYRVAVGGHRLSVTHTDGYPVRPVQVDSVILGMGERYDVVVTAQDGVFPIVAVPEGKTDPAALAVLRTAAGPAPSVNARPKALSGQLLTYGDLIPLAQVGLSRREPDRELAVDLQMVNGGREWFINNKPYDQHQALEVAAGERVRLNFRNQTMMFHPMHLHGHTFAVDGTGVRKDTVNVLPMQTLPVDLQADNPGQWLLHCHNAYHGELGMMTVLSYLT
jgi:FtsP/CotA-like multicopper oxidase with cupredoxin domain